MIVRYTPNGCETVTVEIADCHAERVLEFVRSRMFPDVKPQAFDERFERMMAKRKAA